MRGVEGEAEDLTYVQRCCGCQLDLGRAPREAWAYLRSLDPWIVLLVLLSAVIAALLYVFNCRGALSSSSSCANGPFGNPWYVWFAAFFVVCVSFELSRLAERLLLFLFSFTIGTALWRLYFYASCISGTGRWLGWFATSQTTTHQDTPSCLHLHLILMADVPSAPSSLCGPV